MANYTTIQGDAWDLISFKLYGNEYFVDDLMEANPRHRYATLFSGGIVLDAPAISTEVAKTPENIPPWRRG